MLVAVTMVLVWMSVVTAQDSPFRDEADQAVLDLIKETYPPLEGRIEVSTEPLKGNRIIKHEGEGEGKGVVVEATFTVWVKNIQEKDAFGFSPGDIDVMLFTIDGKPFPSEDYRWNESGHGETGTYKLAPGKQNGKHITLRLFDKEVKPDSRYLVVATYVQLYEGPPVGFDQMAAIRVISAVEEAPAEDDEAGKE
jgi:hypothetical protein